MPTEKPRYTVIVDDELLKRIDDFRFENRYSSRSAATLELIRVGLEELEKEKKKKISLLIKNSLFLKRLWIQSSKPLYYLINLDSINYLF